MLLRELLCGTSTDTLEDLQCGASVL